MVSRRLESFSHAPSLALIPGIMAPAMAPSVSVIADVARDALDPTLPQTGSLEALAHWDARHLQGTGSLRPKR